MKSLLIYSALIVGMVVTPSLSAAEIDNAPIWSTPGRTDIRWQEPSKDEYLSLEGSARQYYITEIDDKYNAPDWFPDQHTPMPAIVRYGKGKKVWACASCHLASGMGHPASARLAGVSSEYMQAQMRVVASGERKDYSAHMSRMAPLMTSQEIKEVSDWFAQLKPVSWYRVIETDQVPETVIDKTRMRIKVEHADMPGNVASFEPINGRIVEIPTDIHRVKLRSPFDGFIAYVESGSIEYGKKLTYSGNGGSAPCVTCHGADLRGTAIAPNIAGLSPMYVVRQLYGFRNGKRKGSDSDMGQMMSFMVQSLGEREIYSVAAYIATLSPNDK